MAKKHIGVASDEYRAARNNCRTVFAAAERQFAAPNGVDELLTAARKLYSDGDEAGAVKEIEHARDWLNGIAVKFLRGGTGYFEGRIAELSYMSLDLDIMDNMRARLKDYCEALRLEDGQCFEQRLSAYTKLASAVNGARDEQFRRNDHREQIARERLVNIKREQRERRREEEEQNKLLAKQRQQEAEASARAEREKQFDELFA